MARSEVKNNCSTVVQFLQTLIHLQTEISEKYRIHCTNIEEAHIWNTFFDFAATSQVITPLLLDRVHFNEVNSVLNKLQTLSSDILNYRAELNATFNDDIYNLDGSAYYMKLTRQFN